MSADCKIHHSVIKRMEADPSYRPGNLIVGGGSCGVRRAPEKFGIGCWRVVHKHGDPIEEVYTKDNGQDVGDCVGVEASCSSNLKGDV